jgi:hypothetical protein
VHLHVLSRWPARYASSGKRAAVPSSEQHRVASSEQRRATGDAKSRAASDERHLVRAASHGRRSERQRATPSGKQRAKPSGERHQATGGTKSLTTSGQRHQVTGSSSERRACESVRRNAMATHGGKSHAAASARAMPQLCMCLPTSRPLHASRSSAPAERSSNRASKSRPPVP